MAKPAQSNTKLQFEALTKNAALEILLPRSPGFDACSALKHGSLHELERLPSRRNLFFDESAAVTLILRTEQSEDDVRALLTSLELTVAAHATEAIPQGTGNAASASGKHDLTSKTLPASELADVVPRENETFVIWNPALQLPRPRARLQRPAVYFTTYLSISAESLASDKQEGKIYLNGFEPLPANVLEPLQFSPALMNTNVFLSETRITKIAPTTGRSTNDVKPLRGASKRAFPIVPALFTRMRYSALPDSAIASLHLETSQVVPGTVVVKNFDLTTADAQVESLNRPDLPLQTLPGDETVLLFKLKARNHTPSPCTISIHIEAAVKQEDSHDIPEIDLDLRWQAQVDLSQTTAKPTYKWSRPMSSSSIRPLARPSIHGDSKAAGLEHLPNNSQEETGVIFNISVPSVIPNRIDFKLHVQCINRSDRPRRFAIVVIEPKKRAMKIETSANSGKPPQIANTRDSPLQTQRPPDVFDINPDVRIGPLPPGACYETELKFWATTRGVLDLGFVRIVDLDTKQTVDVRDLPDVVVLDPSEG